MIRALTAFVLVASLPAWAVGEHIAVTGPAREQLSQTLCISMECSGGGDYTVSSKLVGNKMELKVIGPTGTRFSVTLPVDDNGRLLNSDAMTATSQLVQAIENPQAQKEAAVEKPKATAKKAKVAKATSKKAKPVRVAARKVTRG